MWLAARALFWKADHEPEPLRCIAQCGRCLPSSPLSDRPDRAHLQSSGFTLILCSRALPSPPLSQAPAFQDWHHSNHRSSENRGPSTTRRKSSDVQNLESRPLTAFTIAIYYSYKEDHSSNTPSSLLQTSIHSCATLSLFTLTNLRAHKPIRSINTPPGFLHPHPEDQGFHVLQGYTQYDMSLVRPPCPVRPTPYIRLLLPSMVLKAKQGTCTPMGSGLPIANAREFYPNMDTDSYVLAFLSFYRYFANPWRMRSTQLKSIEAQILLQYIELSISSRIEILKLHTQRLSYHLDIFACAVEN
ncbi:hypothetical protein DFH27DRAFT_521863 [Peziza echinospora]|nr:hypothetical protein DFH27DRAFT_521863 [Peziza echinospora]